MPIYYKKALPKRKPSFSVKVQLELFFVSRQTLIPILIPQYVTYTLHFFPPDHPPIQETIQDDHVLLQKGHYTEFGKQQSQRHGYDGGKAWLIN